MWDMDEVVENVYQHRINKDSKEAAYKIMCSAMRLMCEMRLKSKDDNWPHPRMFYAARVVMSRLES